MSEKRRCETWIFWSNWDSPKNVGGLRKKKRLFFRGSILQKLVSGTPTEPPSQTSPDNSPRLEIEDDDVSDPVSDKVPPAQEPEPAMPAPVRQFAPLPEGFTQNAYEVGLEASQTLIFLDVVHVDERRFVGFSGFCVAKKGSFKRRCAIDDDLDMWNSRPPTLTVAS